MDNAAKGVAQKIISELEKIVHALTHAPGEQHETGVGPQETSSQENDSRRGKSPLRAHIEPTPINPQQPEQPWYKTLQGWKSVAELIAIPFAIGYAVITYLQWRDIRNNFELAQRAWVATTSADLLSNVSEGDTVRWGVNMKNSGMSPAIKARIHSYILITEDFENVRKSVAKPPRETAPTAPIAPGGILGHIEQGPFYTSTERIQLLNTPGMQLYIAGRIDYSDIFGDSRLTTFCYFWARPKGTLDFCEKLNDMR